MRYFVVDANGNRYGPADLATLNAWAREGRVLPGMLIEEESSGARMVASSVAGLMFPGAGAPPPAQYVGYARPGYATATGSSTDVTWAWILGALGFCCGPLSLVGLFFGQRAKQNSQPGGQAAFVFCMVSFTLWIGWMFVRFAVLGSQLLR